MQSMICHPTDRCEVACFLLRSPMPTGKSTPRVPIRGERADASRTSEGKLRCNLTLKLLHLSVEAVFGLRRERFVGPGRCFTRVLARSCAGRVVLPAENDDADIAIERLSCTAIPALVPDEDLALALLVLLVAVAMIDIESNAPSRPASVTLAAIGYAGYFGSVWLCWLYARRFERSLGLAVLLALFMTAMAAFYLVATAAYIVIDARLLTP